MKRTTLVWRNLVRQRTHSIFAAVGIVFGVSMLLFFSALSVGVQRNVVAKIIPERQIEVVPRTLQLGAFQRRGGLFGSSSSGLTDYTLADLKAIPGVVGVYPRQQLGFPALARGGAELVGEDLYAELLADGIPADLVPPTLRRAEAGDMAFVDWSALERCSSAADCATSDTCVSGRCEAARCTPADEVWWATSRLDASRALSSARGIVASGTRFEIREFVGEGGAPIFAVVVADGLAREALDGAPALTSLPGSAPERRACPSDANYCDRDARRCQMAVPVLVSPMMLELYNGNFQSMMAGAAGNSKPPMLSEDAIIGMTFDATLGRGMLGVSRGVREGRQAAREVRLRVVGFSPLAIPLGVTLPMGYVTRWNAQYGDRDASGSWSSILVEVAQPSDVNPTATVIEDELGLAIHDRFEMARRVAGLVAIVTWVFAGIGLLMMGVASVNIAHTFMMLVSERRREIGILRSLGATRLDVTVLLMSEAAVIGLIGWAVAFGCARLFAFFVDFALHRWVPTFPWKPTTLFVFEPVWVFASLVVALLCALLGSWFPSARAARMDPADALRERE